MREKYGIDSNNENYPKLADDMVSKIVGKNLFSFENSFAEYLDVLAKKILRRYYISQ